MVSELVLQRAIDQFHLAIFIIFNNVILNIYVIYMPSYLVSYFQGYYKGKMETERCDREGEEVNSKLRN